MACGRVTGNKVLINVGLIMVMCINIRPFRFPVSVSTISNYPALYVKFNCASDLSAYCQFRWGMISLTVNIKKRQLNLVLFLAFHLLYATESYSIEKLYRSLNITCFEEADLKRICDSQVFCDFFMHCYY